MSLFNKVKAARAEKKERETYDALLTLTNNRLPSDQEPRLIFKADGQKELWLRYHGRDHYSLGELKDISWEGDQRMFKSFMVFQLDQWGGIKAQRLSELCYEYDSAGKTVRKFEGRDRRADKSEKLAGKLQSYLHGWLKDVNQMGYTDLQENAISFDRRDRGPER